MVLERRNRALAVCAPLLSGAVPRRCIGAMMIAAALLCGAVPRRCIGAVMIGAVAGVAALVSAPPSPASIEPTRPAAPTGCASGVFSLAIEARPGWGVVPFEAHLLISLVSPTDSVESVWWDFESDGSVDASGLEVGHVFDQPVDYAVTATVTTSERGEIGLRRTIEGYVAVMSLTFDDGCASVHSQAMPLLDARGLTATAYVIPTWVGNFGALYLRWDDVLDLADHGWDIGSHTMTHVSLKGVDDSTLHYELGQSLIELKARGFDVVSFSLPFGQYDQHALDAVKMYYESCRAVGNALNPPVEFADPYLLLSKTGQPWLSLGSYKADIDGVAATGGWYILNNHRVRPDCYSSDCCIETQTLADLIDYAMARRLKVACVREVLEYRAALQVNSGLPDGFPDSPGNDSPAASGVEWSVANPLTLPGTIEFVLPSPAAVRASIYDCAGRHVRDLECGAIEKAKHQVTWDGLNAEGEPVASGAYYCMITAGGQTHSSGPILVVR